MLTCILLQCFSTSVRVPPVVLEMLVVHTGLLDPAIGSSNVTWQIAVGVSHSEQSSKAYFFTIPSTLSLLMMFVTLHLASQPGSQWW